MRISAKFQLHPPYGFLGDDFCSFFFFKLSLSVAMATNQIQRFGQNSSAWQMTTQGNFCNTFVKISSVR